MEKNAIVQHVYIIIGILLYMLLFVKDSGARRTFYQHVKYQFFTLIKAMLWPIWAIIVICKFIKKECD